MTLHWTKEKPTEAGWYWVRWTDLSSEEVLRFGFHKQYGFVAFCGEGEVHTPSEMSRNEFAGPIPEPEQPIVSDGAPAVLLVRATPDHTLEETLATARKIIASSE